MMTDNLPKKLAASGDDDKVYLKYKFKENPDTGRREAYEIELSDNTLPDSPEFMEKLTCALKNMTGSSNPEIADRIVSKIAWAMSSDDDEHRLKEVTTLLHTLEPQNESEALLLGQFLALQDSGMQCLHNANYNEMFYHKKELFQLSVKLLRCANETMQTLLKYRSGGKQLIQVIHVSGEGKAVIANEMRSGG
ncbi:MAG: hypothetical protein K1000chlam3_00134 [Chlamydiae bacterium]|nr:hypothetical protein [Chlamydiota bacterium]